MEIDQHIHEFGAVEYHIQVAPSIMIVICSSFLRLNFLFFFYAMNE